MMRRFLSDAVVLIALAAVVPAVFVGCAPPAPVSEPPAAPVAPKAAEAPQRVAPEAAEAPQPVEAETPGEELLANPSFEQGLEGWRMLPEKAGAVEAAGAADGGSAIRLSPPPKKGYTTLQQPIQLVAGSEGKAITARVHVKGAKSKQVGAAIEVVGGAGKRRLVQADAVGSQGWETLTATAEVPQLAEGEQLLFRVFLRPAAKSPVLIDGASVKLTQE